MCVILFPFYFLFPDTKLVGPLLSSPAKPLPGDLQQFVMGSGDEGVILVSFGSILSQINDQTIERMAAAFSSLPQRVIWKLDAGNWVMSLVDVLLLVLFIKFSVHKPRWTIKIKFTFLCSPCEKLVFDYKYCLRRNLNTLLSLLASKERFFCCLLWRLKPWSSCHNDNKASIRISKFETVRT